MKTFRALAIGDRPSGELAAAMSALGRAMSTVFLPTLPAAVQRYSAGLEPPDLLVLFQSRPGQFLEGDLLHLRAWLPLARAVTVLGSWCEGETRSGQPLLGVRRVAWHAWPVRLQRELSAWQSGGGGWSLPATAAEEELLLAADAAAGGDTGRDQRPASALPVAVRSGHVHWAECLADALSGHRRKAVSLLPVRAAQPDEFAALVDDVRLPASGAELSRHYQAWQPKPIIALADFPRRQDERTIRGAGATTLLGKPLDMADLAWLLDQVLRGAGA
jgi:CheY-like chemotaxis protein